MRTVSKVTAPKYIGTGLVGWGKCMPKFLAALAGESLAHRQGVVAQLPAPVAHLDSHRSKHRPMADADPEHEAILGRLLDGGRVTHTMTDL